MIRRSCIPPVVRSGIVVLEGSRRDGGDAWRKCSWSGVNHTCLGWICGCAVDLVRVDADHIAVARATSSESRTVAGAAMKARLGRHRHARVCATPKAHRVSCDAVIDLNVSGNVGAGATPQGYGPADLQAAYQLPATSADGRTVAVVDAYDLPSAEADLAVYRAHSTGYPRARRATAASRR